MGEGLNFKVVAVFIKSGRKWRAAHCEDVVEINAYLRGTCQFNFG
jgi:hypothetical protein